VDRLAHPAPDLIQCPGNRSTDEAMGGAENSGSFRIGGEVAIRRLGVGAMRITGAGIWGDPADPEECRRTLQRVPELGVDFIDTADSYGPSVSEELIREVLHPYPGLVIATKAGQVRPAPDTWIPLGRPEYLIQQVHVSRRRLGVERIDLWQLHRIDPLVPRDEQFDVIKSFLAEGLIRFAGLSAVTVEEIEAARRFFPVATVQNLYHIADRSSEAVLDYCENNGIGFIPWRPLSRGDLGPATAAVAAVARKYGATPLQIALAWLLKRSPVMLPIPGTGKVGHMEENVAAAGIELSDDDFAALDKVGKR